LRPRYLAAAGLLLFLTGVVAFMGIITAESLYPAGYSTSENEISDLGGTEPPDSVIEEPSATIFNTAMMVAGAFIILAAICMRIGFGRWAAPVLIGLFGLGVLGVGIFPGDTGTIHALFAMLTFVAGGVAAIVSLTIVTPPLSYVSVLLGAHSPGWASAGWNAGWHIPSCSGPRASAGTYWAEPAEPLRGTWAPCSTRRGTLVT